MDRREFITWIGVGGLAASLPVAIAACNPETNTADSTAPSTDATDSNASPAEAVGSVADLDANGQILDESANVGPILIIRSPDDPNTIMAVNPTCTHQGCIVSWIESSGLFVCACHGSQFAQDGSVNRGPASRPLDTYQIDIEGDEILVNPS